MHACCGTIIWAKFGLFERCYLGQERVIIWAKVIFSAFYGGFKFFFAHSVVILRCSLPSHEAICKNSAFQKLCAETVFYSKFLVLSLSFKKSLFKTLLKLYKNRVLVIIVVFSVVLRAENNKNN